MVSPPVLRHLDVKNRLQRSNLTLYRYSETDQFTINFSTS